MHRDNVNRLQRPAAPVPPPRPYTVFMLLQAQPDWQALPREQREALCDDALMQVYNRFAAVRLRWHDASAFHGRCTDVLVWETTDLPEYHEAVATLRRHAFLDRQHFALLDVITTIPDGWREYAWETGMGDLSAVPQPA
ncbi:darcynin family protein [Aquabacterium sp.]|uniref:darcynin family protein n=1 Tax=Aquabacterium sp. TaxID=1872578 RepID=UPI003784485E